MNEPSPRGDNGGSPPVNPLTFEEALGELDQIVRDLEDGNVSLEESLARYEQGVGLLKRCYTQLREAEQKIRDLQSMSDALKQLVEHCRGDHRPNCPILEALAVPAGPGKRAVTRKGSSEACH